MPLLNVRIAAQLTGKDRSTITRAIEAGKLSASKDEHGRYRIDPAELERVFGTLRTPDAESDARADAVHDHAHAEHAPALVRELELMREMLARERMLHERERQTWDEERIFLRKLVDEQTIQVKLLTDQRQPEARAGSWRRLFRRG